MTFVSYGINVSEAIGRPWDDAEGNSTSAVSMLKSLDWAKATAEKRATLITSLDCIFAVVSIWDREREEVWRCLEKAAKERMKEESCVDSKDTKGRYLRATRENFGLWKV